MAARSGERTGKSARLSGDGGDQWRATLFASNRVRDGQYPPKVVNYWQTVTLSGFGVRMLQGWAVIAVALVYIGLLFLVASYGDRARRASRDSRTRLLIYPLSLAIYCTSWTFFGSVGSASRSGYEFLTIYIGPGLMIGLFAPLIGRVGRLAKAQNITSIADFIAARYGKSQAVAATVALIAIVGTVPYIALQLKAVPFSLEPITAPTMPVPDTARPLLGDMALYVALSM